MNKKANTPFTLMQFSDTHFRDNEQEKVFGLDTTLTFKQTAEHALKQHPQPDAYLLTGDLSQDGSIKSYERLAKELSGFQAPIYCLPGNHDSLTLMRSTLAAGNRWIKKDLRAYLGAWQIIMLDSVIEGEVGGYLKPSELLLLEEALNDNSYSYALICMHHHPISMKSPWVDAVGISNAAEFLAMVDRYPQVKGVIWGHVHQESQTNRQGVKFMSCPSTCAQFKPHCEQATMDDLPAGYRIIKLHADGEIESFVERAIPT